MDGVIRLAESLKVLVFFKCLSATHVLIRFELAHIKHRFGHDILLAGPVAEVALAAALAAKRKVRVHFGIGWRFANRATMFHDSDSRRLVTRLSPNHDAGIFLL